MTWAEILILVSVVGAAGGFAARRTRIGRFILVLSMFVLGLLLAVFGRELASDLF